MTALAWLIPVALLLGGLGLWAFLWALGSGQFDDLDGAAWRALEDRTPDSADTAPHEATLVAGTHGETKGYIITGTPSA